MSYYLSTSMFTCVKCLYVMNNRHMRKCMALAVILGVLLPYHYFTSYHTGTLKSKRSLPIIIVDEHHEVIPYWINAVQKKMIANSNNLLIHFDAHSDLGTPSFSPMMPFFQWPKKFTSSVTRALMESNDVFIISAVIMGLFDHVLWIYPTWISEKVANYNKCVIGVGLYDVRNSKESLSYCLCLNCTSNRKCVILVRGPENPEIVIPSNSCKVHRRFKFDTLREDRVMEHLRTQNLLDKQTLLDFDEDYFGVESPAINLLNAGMNFTKVESLNYMIEDLFCPKSSTQEQTSGRFLHQLVQKVLSCKQTNSCNRRKIYLTSRTFTMLRRGRVFHDTFCSQETILTKINQVIYVLDSFSPKELYLLLDVGFCLTSSPKFESGNPFHVCHGLLLPNDIVVKLKNTSLTEINERVTLLGNILSFLSKLIQPKLVTIARSIRDGYTPRHFYQIIEAEIIMVIQKSFDLDASSKLIYDDDVLQI